MDIVLLRICEQAILFQLSVPWAERFVNFQLLLLIICKTCMEAFLGTLCINSKCKLWSLLHMTKTNYVGSSSCWLSNSWWGPRIYWAEEKEGSWRMCPKSEGKYASRPSKQTVAKAKSSWQQPSWSCQVFHRFSSWWQQLISNDCKTSNFKHPRGVGYCWIPRGWFALWICKNVVQLINIYVIEFVHAFNWISCLLCLKLILGDNATRASLPDVILCVHACFYLLTEHQIRLSKLWCIITCRISVFVVSWEYYLHIISTCCT